MDESLPLLLTVEEAGEVLRIGRTKAYAMAREWRITAGRSGLPVIDLGNVLRVPRRALEQLIGTELTGPLSNGGQSAGNPKAAQRNVDSAGGSTSHGATTEANPRRLPRRSHERTRPAPSDDQLPLFASRPPTT